MKTVLETNDPILLSLAEAVLQSADIGCVVLDRHVAALYGGSDVVTQRLCVLDEDEAEAEVLVTALKARPFAAPQIDDDRDDGDDGGD